MRAAATFVKITTLLSFMLFFVITGCSSIGGSDGGGTGIGDGPNIKWLFTDGTTNNESCYQVIENSEGEFISMNETAGPVTTIQKISDSGYKTYEYSFTDVSYIPVELVENSNGYAVLTEYYEVSQVVASRITFLDEDLIDQGSVTYTEPYALDPAALAYASEGFYYEVGKFTNQNSFSEDIYVRKMAAEGSQIWYEEYGNLENEYVKSAIINTAGNLVIAGNIQSELTNYMDFFIKVIDGNGELVWEYRGDLNGNQWCRQIIEGEDGNYYVAGYSNDGTGYDLDAYVLSVDNEGQELWEKRFGETDGEAAMSITNYNGGLAVTGYTESQGSGARDIYVFSMSYSGIMNWDGTDGGSADDQGNYVYTADDGGLVICGFTKSYGNGGSDIRVLKLEAESSTEE